MYFFFIIQAFLEAMPQHILVKPRVGQTDLNGQTPLIFLVMFNTAGDVTLIIIKITLNY